MGGCGLAGQQPEHGDDYVDDDLDAEYDGDEGDYD